MTYKDLSSLITIIINLLGIGGRKMEIPKDVMELLRNEKLCTMATSWEDKPYLSLMNFTYIEE